MDLRDIYPVSAHSTDNLNLVQLPLGENRHCIGCSYPSSAPACPCYASSHSNNSCNKGRRGCLAVTWRSSKSAYAHNTQMHTWQHPIIHCINSTALAPGCDLVTQSCLCVSQLQLEYSKHQGQVHTIVPTCVHLHLAATFCFENGMSSRPIVPLYGQPSSLRAVWPSQTLESTHHICII